MLMMSVCLTADPKRHHFTYVFGRHVQHGQSQRTAKKIYYWVTRGSHPAHSKFPDGNFSSGFDGSVGKWVRSVGEVRGSNPTENFFRILPKTFFSNPRFESQPQPVSFSDIFQGGS